VQTTPSSIFQFEPTVRAPSLPFRALYEQHFAFTWRTLRYLGVPEAQLDDAAQEVWMVVHRRYAEFQGRSEVKTWLFSIAINVERNLHRTRRRRGELVPLPDDLPAGYGDPVLEREGSEAWGLVRSFLETLDDTRRAVFGAALLEGLSPGETAEATGLDLATVYHRIRALRRSFDRWVNAQRVES
jgi:RNA polymerase sigma-70 factor (ECF subfamily)